MEYNNNQSFEQFGSSNSYTPSYKPRGLNLFNVNIFEIYNPKSASVVFGINVKDGALTIAIAPAIPNNPAINMRGPVPANTKVYDYSRKVTSVFSDIDAIGLVEFLREKFINSSNIADLVSQNKMYIENIYSMLSQCTEVQQVVNALPSIEHMLASLSAQNDRMLKLIDGSNSSEDNNTFGIYRKMAGSPDKVWNFNYDPSYHMLHINLLYGQEKIRCSISKKMACKLLAALESYVSNIATLNVIGDIAQNISKTFAINNVLAPKKGDQNLVE